MRRLCFLALQHEANRLAKLAAGNQHSLFTGRDGSVSTCGSESRDLAGLRPLGTHTVPKEEWSLLMC